MLKVTTTSSAQQALQFKSLANSTYNCTANQNAM